MTRRSQRRQRMESFFSVFEYVQLKKISAGGSAANGWICFLVIIFIRKQKRPAGGSAANGWRAYFYRLPRDLFSITPWPLEHTAAGAGDRKYT